MAVQPPSHSLLSGVSLTKTVLQRGNSGVLPQERGKKGKKRKETSLKKKLLLFFSNYPITKTKRSGASVLNGIISPPHAEPNFKGPDGAGSNGKSLLWLANQRQGRRCVGVSSPSGGRSAVTFRTPSHFLYRQRSALTELRSPPQPVSAQF